MTAANTFECFREFVGLRVVGVLKDALPRTRRDLARGCKTLIFEDGRGLTIASNGSYWIDSAEDIQAVASLTRRRLEETSRDLREVLELAGAADA